MPAFPRQRFRSHPAPGTDGPGRFGVPAQVRPAASVRTAAFESVETGRRIPLALDRAAAIAPAPLPGSDLAGVAGRRAWIVLPRRNAGTFGGSPRRTPASTTPRRRHRSRRRSTAWRTWRADSARSDGRGPDARPITATSTRTSPASQDCGPSTHRIALAETGMTPLMGDRSVDLRRAGAAACPRGRRRGRRPRSAAVPRNSPVLPCGNRPAPEEPDR